MELSTLKLTTALILLPLVLGSFVYIDTWVMSSPNWYESFKARLFHPAFIVYFGFVAPAVIYWTQKIIYDNSKGSVWAVNILVAVLLQVAGLVATYLASKTFPAQKEVIALIIIASAMVWSRT